MTKEEKQLERKKFAEILDVLSHMEIRGEANVFYMYQLMSFLKTEITKLDKELETEK